MFESSCITIANPVESVEGRTVPQTVAVFLSFGGTLPDALKNRKIPVKITLSLPDDLAPHLTSRILASVVHSTASEELGSSCMDTREYPLEPICTADPDEWEVSPPSREHHDPLAHLARDATPSEFPFLPLPRFFSASEQHSWLGLSEAIQSWLVSNTNLAFLHSPEWSWAANLFWMTYLAAYPSFPCGPWVRWDPIIPMEGPFVSNWLLNRVATHPHACNNDNDDVVPCAACSHAREEIWIEFQQVVGVYYPIASLKALN